MAKNLSINIDVLLKGAEQINKLADSLKRLKGAADSVGSPTSGGGQPKSAANDQAKAADATLKHAQAQARLLQALGNTAAAQKLLTTATKNHEGSVRQLIAAQTQLARLQTGGGILRFASTIREAGESIQQTGYFLTGLSTSLIAVGAAAVKSAFAIDRNINTLKALLGSVDAAESRFAALRNLSQVTPGLTTGLAAQLDVQLRVANATEKAINKVLPAIGKLNAVSSLQDPQRFAQNLVQLVTQNFERIDLKELVGQSPLAGEIIKQIFNVDSAIDGARIRAQAQKLGLTTVDAFFTAFGDAAARNPKLANITESLETQFAKIIDRVTNALRPLGQAIISTLGPIVERGAQIIEGLSEAFNALPEGLRNTIVVLGTLAVAIGPAVVGIGAFIQGIGALGNLASVAKSLQAVTVALQTMTAASTAAGTAAATAGTTTAVAFAPVLPILLAVAAVVGIAAIAWANYESAAEAAAKITSEQVQSTARSRDELIALSTELDKSAGEHDKLIAIMDKLPPTSKTVAEALKTEAERAAFLTGELKRLRTEREAQLVGQQSALAAGVAEGQARVDAARQELASLEQAIRDNQARQQAGLTTALVPGSLVGSLTTVADAQAKLGAMIEETRRKEQDAIKTRDEAARKLGTLQEAIGLNTNELLKYQTQAGTSKAEVSQLERGLSEYESQMRKAAGVTDEATGAMNDLGAAARQAGQDVANAFLQFDLQGIERGIQTKTRELAQRIVKEGISAKQALADAQNEIIGTVAVEGDNFPAVLSFSEANKRARALQKAQEQLNKLLNPQQKRGGGGRSSRIPSDAASQDLLSERQQLEEALLKLRQAMTTADTDLARQASDEQRRILEAEYQDKQITTEKYFDRKAALIEADLERERQAVRLAEIAESDRLNLLETRRDAGIEAANKRESDLLRQAKTAAERAKVEKAAAEEREKVLLDFRTQRAAIEEKLVGISADLQKTENQAATAARENDRERIRSAEEIADAYLKLRSEISSIDADLDESAGNLVAAATARTQQQFGELLREATAEFGENSAQVAAILARIRSIILDAALQEFQNARRLVDTEFGTEINRVQNLVNAGLLDERSARDQVLAVEQQQRAELEKILKLEIERARVSLPEGASKRQKLAELNAQLVQVQALGIDPIFAEIRNGLQNDLSGAFNDFIANARFNLEGLRDFAAGVINSFRRAIAKALSDQIEKSLVTPITNAFLEKILGIKTVDTGQLAATVSTDANTSATVANTAALTANTAARSGQSIADQVGGVSENFDFDNLGADAGASAGAEVAGPGSSLTAFFDKVKSGFEKFAKGLQSLVTGVGGGLKSALASIFNLISSAVGAIFRALGGGGAKFSQPPSFSFAEGGYTGEGGKYQPAGIVHAGEYVIPANRVEQFGAGFFEAIRRGAFNPAAVSDYLSGLSNISVRARSGSFASGGLAGVAPVAAESAATSPQSLRIINVNDPAQAEEFLNSAAGEQVILNRISKSPAKWRAALKI